MCMYILSCRLQVLGFEDPADPEPPVIDKIVVELCAKLRKYKLMYTLSLFFKPHHIDLPHVFW